MNELMILYSYLNTRILTLFGNDTLFILKNRIVTLFGMICHLEGNVMKTLAKSILVDAKPSAKSWIQEIRDTCI